MGLDDIKSAIAAKMVDKAIEMIGLDDIEWCLVNMYTGVVVLDRGMIDG